MWLTLWRSRAVEIKPEEEQLGPRGPEGREKSGTSANADAHEARAAQVTDTVRRGSGDRTQAPAPEQPGLRCQVMGHSYQILWLFKGRLEIQIFI